MLRRILLAFALVLAPLLPPNEQSLRAQPSLEYQVKAAYISKLSPFIDWPSSAFAAPNAPLVICIVGNDPFGAALDRAVEGTRDRDHPLQVRRLPTPDPDAACHILFAGDAAIAGQAIEQMRARPVVTVTDSGQPARGMLSFVIAANHVRFDIDAAAAERVGLRFSSKLLALARTVRRASR
ncbi:MAG TPA: YfiR family protein [Rhizomicrobium sp.]|nr:YfiR family protein [Rhizomicrobium sp.]